MTTIKLKNGSGAPATSDLVQGEPALDLTNKRLYTENASGAIIEIGTNPTSLTTGTFTSTGIDDNATSTKLTVADTSITTGSIDQLIVAHSTDGGGIRIDSTNATNIGSLRFGDVSDNYIGALEYSHTDNAMSMYVNNATRMTIDSSGRMIIGNTSSVSVSGGDRQFQVQGTNGVTSSGTFYRSQASTGAPSINLAKDRGSLTTAVISGDSIGAVNFVGSDGTDLSNIGATISATISGSVSNNVLPTDLIFSTNGGSSSTSERMRISSSGDVGIGTTSPLSAGSTFGSVTVNGSAGGEYYLATGGTAKGNLFNYSANANHVGLAAVDSSGELLFSTGGYNERMRINSSGDVGIGSASNHSGARVVINDTPPTAFGSPMLQVGQETFTASGYYSIGFGFTTGTYTEPPAEIAAVSTSSSGGTTADIVFGTRSVTTNTAVTERMRIDSSGNVGIGVSAAAGGVNYGRKLQVHSAAGGGASVHITDSSTGSTTSDGLELITFGAAAYIWNREASFMSFGTSATERMRIDSSGNLLVGKTTSGYTVIGAEIQDSGDVMIKSAGAPLVLNRDTAGPNATIQAFYLEDTLAGIIAVTKSGTPAFAASSDERLKESITDHESELSHVMSLRPVRWDWKDSSKGAGEGFVAQELEQTAWSDLVSDGEDGYKMVSGLGAVETRLIKALQEAVTRIETLEAEVAALKGE